MTYAHLLENNLFFDLKAMGDSCCGGNTAHKTTKTEGCCGGGHCGSHSDDKQQAGGCCGGGCGSKDGAHVHDVSATTGGSDCCSDNGCGCEHEQELQLSAEQIAKINSILGDIDDEDLETGNYDLTNEQAAELNNILFGTKNR